jgi:hypothetical protein
MGIQEVDCWLQTFTISGAMVPPLSASLILGVIVGLHSASALAAIPTTNNACSRIAKVISPNSAVFFPGVSEYLAGKVWNQIEVL